MARPRRSKRSRSRPGEPRISRLLTRAEREIAGSIFGKAIDYDAVRIHHRRWWPFQPRNTVMAPCGHLHVPANSDLWQEDYGTGPAALQGLFLHEMTHVWQSQLRGKYYLPLMRHPFCRYRYTLEDGLAFTDYGLEQQGEIVRHVFLGRLGLHVPGAPPLGRLETLLPFGPQAETPRTRS